MSKRVLIVLAAVCGWMAASTSLQAADTWPLERVPSEKVVELQVTLGTDLDELVLTPDKLRLEVDKTYRLVIKNPSSMTHSFWAPGLAGYASWTLLVSVDKGKVGLIQEPGKEYVTWQFEVQPGGTAVWQFVPDVPGRYKWGCSQPEHADAGMVGELQVTPG